MAEWDIIILMFAFSYRVDPISTERFVNEFVKHISSHMQEVSIYLWSKNFFKNFDFERIILHGVTD